MDKLLLRQQQGFRCVNPSRPNTFGIQFERVLPAPQRGESLSFNYSGKLDSKRASTSAKTNTAATFLVNFDQRDEDKTLPANILILGNSGQGKSYPDEAADPESAGVGKSVTSLDAEHESRRCVRRWASCFADLMAGQYIINVLEPSAGDDGGPQRHRRAGGPCAKAPFWLSISPFLKDFSGPKGFQRRPHRHH